MTSRQLASLLPLALALLSPAFGAPAPGADECRLLDVRAIGHAQLVKLTSTPGIDSWLELDDELFLCGSTAALAALEDRAAVARPLGPVDRERLRLAYRSPLADLERRGLRVISAGGLFALVEIPRSQTAAGREAEDLLPVPRTAVLARQLANQPRARQPSARRLSSATSTIATLTDAVTADRWFADVESLAAYNRYSYGEEIEQARVWLARQFRRLPGVKVQNHFFEMDGARVGNVVATLPGRIRPQDWFLVGGHYDSTSGSPQTAAPGAEDNASGCAGVLEIARIFAAHPPEATILFICYAGEEQGLLGSADHIADLVAAGEAEKIGAMFNLDMIGFTADADLDVLLQVPPSAQFLGDALTEAAARHTRLRVVTTPLAGGSDHVPYILAGVPAVLSIENDWNIYPHYHRTTDTPDKLTPDMAVEILRMNVGALARFTGNGDVAGCLRAGGEALADAKVSASQRGRRRETTSSDRQGCFVIDPLARGSSFRLRVTGALSEAGDGDFSGCVRLLGDPLSRRRVVFRHSGATSRGRTDGAGCFSFPATAGERFTLKLKGPAPPPA